DYGGNAEALGKNVGDDLREGKPTLPLIRVMEVGTPAQRFLVHDAILHGDGDFEAVARAVQETDALEYTRKAAVAEAELARSALGDWPLSIHRDSLLELCSFAVSRDREQRQHVHEPGRRRARLST